MAPRKSQASKKARGNDGNPVASGPAETVRREHESEQPGRFEEDASLTEEAKTRLKEQGYKVGGEENIGEDEEFVPGQADQELEAERTREDEAELAQAEPEEEVGEEEEEGFGAFGAEPGERVASGAQYGGTAREGEPTEETIPVRGVEKISGPTSGPEPYEGHLGTKEGLQGELSGTQTSSSQAKSRAGRKGGLARAGRTPAGEISGASTKGTAGAKAT